MFGGNEGYGYQQPGVFRDIDPVLVKDLQFGDELDNLKNNFKNRDNQRVLDNFYPDGASATLQFMKINIKDLVDFLLCVLRKNCENISLDDYEYIISVQYKTFQICPHRHRDYQRC